MIGRKLGDFEIVEEIGKGGMGKVYRAIQKSLNREVAIKVLSANLSSNEEFVERFDLEAKSVAKLNQKNILQMYSKGVAEDGIHYFAMEYVNGEDLAIKLKRGEKFSEEKAIDIIIQSCRGLEEAQKYEIIHRDIKPSNIMITNNGVVKIADFGLAKSLEATMKLTRTDVFMGTVNYTSPEQGMGKPVDHRTDIYSLGIVLYQILTNELPFDAGSAAAVIYKHIHEKPPKPRKINPNVSSSLEAVVLKAIEKKPEDRYRNMREFREALESVISRKSEKVDQKGKSLTYIIIVGPVLLLVIVVYFFLLSSPSETQQAERIRNLIPQVTDVSKAEDVRGKFESFQKKYPKSTFLKLISDSLERMERMVIYSNDIINIIKSTNCIENLDQEKDNILQFSKNFPEFEKTYANLHGFLKNKEESLENTADNDFANAKNSINQAKTSGEIEAINEIFSKHVCANYRDYWNHELKRLSQKRIEELDIDSVLMQLSKAENIKEIENIYNKHKQSLKGVEYQKKLSDKTEDMLNGIISKRINDAKGLCDLNKITQEFNLYFEKYSTLKKQVDVKMTDFEKKNQSDFKSAISDIDSKWNNEEIRNIITEFEEKHECSNLSEELKKYAESKIKKDDVVVSEYELLLKELSGISDLEILNTIKQRIDKFSQENKNSPYASKLIENWTNKYDKLTGKVNEEKAFENAKRSIENMESPSKAYRVYLDFRGNYPDSEHLLNLEDFASLKVAILNVANATTESEIGKIMNEFSTKLRLDENVKILSAEINKKIEDLKERRKYDVQMFLEKKIAEAKDLCELNQAEEELNQYSKKNGESTQLGIFTEQIKNKRKELQTIQKAKLKEAEKKLDNEWSVEKINLILSQIKKENLCKYFIEDLDEYLKIRIEKLTKLTEEYDSILKSINEAPDVNALDSIKNVVNAFEQKNKGYPYTSKLRDILDMRQREKNSKINEEKAFENAKLSIENAENQELVSKIFVEFKKKYPESEYLTSLEKSLNLKKTKIKNVPTPGKIFELPSTGIEFVYIPGGTFSMGDLFGEGDEDEMFIQEKSIEGFWMSKCEITQGQWKKFMDNNPSYFNNGDDYPVEMISWNDVQTFIRKVNLLNNNQYNVRLPTEAEWEYACREGGKKVRFGNGKDSIDPTSANFNGTGRFKDSYSIAGEYVKKTTRVVNFLPNALGLYDMSGNVSEWTQDTYNIYTGKQGTDNYSIKSIGDFIVTKGGSWNSRPKFLRAAEREYFPPDTKLYDCGFRLAFSFK